MKPLKASIKLFGMNAEKFAARLGQEKIPVLNVRAKKDELTFLCALNDASHAADLAKKRGYRVEGPKPVGLAALINTARGRLCLLAGCLLFAALAAFAMTRIWSVQIVDAAEYAGEIRLALEEKGVHAFLPRSALDLNALRDALEWRLPKVKWINVYYSGVSLIVKVVPGTSPGEAMSYHGAGDIIASEDGIVKTILTFAGTPLVRAGDTVRKGQVLIQGLERSEKETQVPVRACGSVMARVFSAASVRVPVTELVSEKTGRSAARRGIVTPLYAFWSAEAPNYLASDLSVEDIPLGGAFLPVVLRRERYDEVALQKNERDFEQVKREAGAAALRKLNLAVGFDDEVIDKWLDYSMIDGDKVVATATAEILREIGRYQKNEP